MGAFARSASSICIKVMQVPSIHSSGCLEMLPDTFCVSHKFGTAYAHRHPSCIRAAAEKRKVCCVVAYLWTMKNLPPLVRAAG